MQKEQEDFIDKYMCRPLFWPHPLSCCAAPQALTFL